MIDYTCRKDCNSVKDLCIRNLPARPSKLCFQFSKNYACFLPDLRGVVSTEQVTCYILPIFTLEGAGQEGEEDEKEDMAKMQSLEKARLMFRYLGPLGGIFGRR